MALAALTLVTGAEAAGPTVRVHVFQFKPGTVAVAPGTRIVWTNEDDIEHTVTAGAPEQPSDRFDIALATKGTSAGVAFAERGVYPYFCKRHQHMRGEIRVE
jgi:plastocyanin